ncbi:hypothetical protein CYMTET_48082 [Cymbomonas tetramitiformis]|uniref:Uncharacterized protein n=1 Tax=Cymbomonas tetramitiformis TaxID=36881 RepID=A0AAE0EVH8_9CHLO|nr:hypothetical protein CYMTET_48082 [Cymbomonas tetramitiformis]
MWIHTAGDCALASEAATVQGGGLPRSLEEWSRKTRRVARAALSPALCLILLHARGACGALPGAVPYPASSAVANQRPKGEQRRCESWVGRDARGRVARAALSPALCLMLLHLRLRISAQRARGACGALPGAVPNAASSAVANQRPKGEQRRCESWVGRDARGRVALVALSPALCLMLLHLRLRISGQRARGACGALPGAVPYAASSAVANQRPKARGACRALPGAVPYAASSAVANQRPKSGQRRREWWVGRDGGGRVARVALSPALCYMLLHLRLRISGQRVSSGAASGGWGGMAEGFPEVHRVTVPAEGQPRLLYKVPYPWDGDEEELWQHEVLAGVLHFSVEKDRGCRIVKTK